MVSWGDAGRAAGIGSNLIGIPFDYAAGKAEGEDDFRAGAGAVASGLGGWGGALQGAALGSALGPLGTAVGGIAGGIAGGFAGGWTADRLDEGIRGKNTGVKNNNMSQAVQLDNGDVAQVDDNGNIVGWLIKGGVVAAGVNATYNMGREIFDTVPTSYARNRAIFQADPALRATAQEAAQYAAREVPVDAMRAAGQGLRNSGNTIGRVWNAIPGNNAMKATAGLVLVGDQLTGGNLSRGVGRAIGGGADMIANAVGFKTDFDGQNKVSQQAIKGNNEMERAERARDTFNPDNDEIYQRGLRNNEDVEAYNNRLFERDKAANREWADKVDEVQRRNYLTNFTANQADALLRGYMSDIPNAVSNAIKGVTSARYN